MTDDRTALQRPRNQNRWPLFGTQPLGARASCPQNLLTNPRLLAGWKSALPGRYTAILQAPRRGESQEVGYERWAGGYHT